MSSPAFLRFSASACVISGPFLTDPAPPSVASWIFGATLGCAGFGFLTFAMLTPERRGGVSGAVSVSGSPNHPQGAAAIRRSTAEPESQYLNHGICENYE